MRGYRILDGALGCTVARQALAGKPGFRLAWTAPERLAIGFLGSTVALRALVDEPGYRLDWTALERPAIGEPGFRPVGLRRSG